MALLNLDKIILHRTVLGPLCPTCGGELQEMPQPAPINRPRWWTFWRRRRTASARYRCGGCGRRYWLSEK